VEKTNKEGQLMGQDKEAIKEYGGRKGGGEGKQVATNT